MIQVIVLITWVYFEIIMMKRILNTHYVETPHHQLVLCAPLLQDGSKQHPARLSVCSVLPSGTDAAESRNSYSFSFIYKKLLQPET